MRIGNASSGTPPGFFTKLTEPEFKKLYTRALLKGKLQRKHSGMHKIPIQSFSAWLPTWYSRGNDYEERWKFKVDGKEIVVKYLDTNTQSAKPGVLAEWIIEIR